MQFSNRFRTITFAITCVLMFPASEAQEAKRIHAPDNIILLIGDGMGVSQIQTGLTANYGRLNLVAFTSIGFSRTQSVNDYVTDSGAGATALATGNKTYNGAIGVNKDSVACKSILEYAEENGLSTGLVSTSAITHATPASFIAHNINRNDYEAIAADFLKTDIDVFIGGGRDNFTKRNDKRDLVSELRSKDYQVVYTTDSLKYFKEGKLAGLTAPAHHPGISDGRNKEMLRASTQIALNILSKNKKGFFLMVEGSQIDWGAHANNTGAVALEMIDFDKAIGVALDFARLYKNTLVIVTADHETGGMALTGGSFKDGKVSAVFATTNHTGQMVPVFAYGPGAELFQGIQENTDIFYKIMRLFRIEAEKPDQP